MYGMPSILAFLACRQTYHVVVARRVFMTYIYIYIHILTYIRMEHTQ